jgi:hypothetical protein
MEVSQVVVWFHEAEANLVNKTQWRKSLFRYNIVTLIWFGAVIFSTHLWPWNQCIFVTSWRCQHRTDFSSHSRHSFTTYEHCMPLPVHIEAQFNRLVLVLRPRFYRNSISRRVQCTGKGIGRSTFIEGMRKRVSGTRGLRLSLHSIRGTVLEELLEKLGVKLETVLDSETCLWVQDDGISGSMKGWNFLNCSIIINYSRIYCKLIIELGR